MSLQRATSCTRMPLENLWAPADPSLEGPFFFPILEVIPLSVLLASSSQLVSARSHASRVRSTRQRPPMKIAHESLKGLDRDRVLSVVEPVLRAHGVDVVELIWRSDQRGWVLYVTVERPDTPDPSLGITLDLCADISRDLSAALDVADVITARYRLEVGSPGVDRVLYEVSDYQ